ncbi:MAG: hypothetical protein ACRELY_32070 [Polyangiaceae bacterium]
MNETITVLLTMTRWPSAAAFGPSVAQPASAVKIIAKNTAETRSTRKTPGVVRIEDEHNEYR